MKSGKNVLIGIYWPPFSGEKDVLRTIDSISLSSGGLQLKLVILADGNTTDLNSAMPGTFSVFRNDGYRGKAYCFNCLTGSGTADFFVFVEAGVLLGPDCLLLLLNAIDEHSEYGLAGPSTNSCWNEQGKISITPANSNYRAIAAQVKREHKNECTELLPLHSLSDFCYVVKKEVVDRIGSADEAYGTGGCWEMDFNIRAARCGFKGVWVKGAFAWRTLNWPREDMQKSRQVYQSRFCARQQQGKPAVFKMHCRGDDCSNFAVPALVQTRIAPMNRQLFPLPTAFSRFLPLVSCIMPTSGRPHFVTKAIRSFSQQNYQNKELIIVYNEESDLATDIDVPTGVRLIKTMARSIGAKRNEACKNAGGTILAQWDDDDVYMPDRLSVQVAPLLSGEYEITGLNNFRFHEIQTGLYWVCTPALFNRLFVENVAGGTLVFLKMLWEDHNAYPPVSLREDADFLMSVIRKGARLERIDGRELFIYMRHSANTWRFNAGTFLHPEEWQLTEGPAGIHASSLTEKPVAAPARKP